MNEVDSVTGGLVSPKQDGVSRETVQGFTARQVVIHHVDVVNIDVTRVYADGRDPQVPSAE